MLFLHSGEKYSSHKLENCHSSPKVKFGRGSGNMCKKKKKKNQTKNQTLEKKKGLRAAYINSHIKFQVVQKKLHITTFLLIAIIQGFKESDLLYPPCPAACPMESGCDKEVNASPRNAPDVSGTHSRVCTHTLAVGYLQVTPASWGQLGMEVEKLPLPPAGMRGGGKDRLQALPPQHVTEAAQTRALLLTEDFPSSQATSWKHLIKDRLLTISDLHTAV